MRGLRTAGKVRLVCLGALLAASAAVPWLAGCGEYACMEAADRPDMPIGLVGRTTAGDPAFDTEEYAHFEDNPFFRVADAPLSTFSIDVDTASYANVRRILREGALPPRGAVRIEEMMNYFRYRYPAPSNEMPFSAAVEVHAAPWEPRHRLLRIGLQGKEVAMKKAPRTNLVFLVDVSGSMDSPDKLPLVKKCLRLVAERLRAQDTVAMVVYAGNAGLVLPATSGNARETIEDAIDNLSADGSTNGGAGIELAYRIAAEQFVKGGVNRVILCTDGDFNVGASSESDLVSLIEEKRKSGVFLSVLGFGTGNYADARMQSLADKGNGNAAYIDTIAEGRKVLVEQMSSTLIAIARDVKIQVEFNPARVAGYRLIGYENRVMAAQDFNDDAKDAGEIGAGHQVTAFYELIPAGGDVPAGSVDPLKYQTPTVASGDSSTDLCTIKLRYKQPDGDDSAKMEFAVRDEGSDSVASPEFDFAASVAAFGMLLRESPHKGQANWDLVLELAKGGLGDDREGWRKEFVDMVKEAKRIARD